MGAQQGRADARNHLPIRKHAGPVSFCLRIEKRMKPRLSLEPELGGVLYGAQLTTNFIARNRGLGLLGN